MCDECAHFSWSQAGQVRPTVPQKISRPLDKGIAYIPSAQILKQTGHQLHCCIHLENLLKICMAQYKQAATKL